MSRNRFKAGDSEHDWLKSFADELDIVEKTWGVYTAMHINLEPRRAVLVVRLESYRRKLDGGKVNVCAYTNQWPNAEVSTWGGFLFQCARRLAAQTEELMKARSDLG